MNTTLKALVLIISQLTFLELAAIQAMTVGPVSMPNSISHSGKTLVLNGMAMETVTFFDIDAYVVGLYLEHKSKSSSAILKSKKLKTIKLEALHNASNMLILEGLSQSLQKKYVLSLCKPYCDKLRSKVKVLVDHLSGVKKGDRLDFLILPNSIEVMINNKLLGKVETGHGIAEALLGIWLDPRGSDRNVSDGILGI